ncbi:MAG: type II secretion system protein GspL [Steroidobacteraceae bacterium]
MKQFLVLRLGAQATWMMLDSSGSQLGPVSSGRLEDAAPLAADRRVIVLVPSSEVLLARPELPARSASRLAQVVPFALEEQLAGDVEMMHFAVGRLESDGRAEVAVVARHRLEEWLGALKATGIKPDALHAESQCLPENPGKKVALLDSGRLMVKAQGADPVTLEAEPLTEAFALAGLEGDASHVQLYVSQEDWDRSENMIDALREVAGSVDVFLLQDGALPMLASLAATRAPLSLLSGGYAPVAPWSERLARWRLPASLAAAWLILHVGYQAVELFRLNAQENQLNLDIEQTFRDAMPDVERIVDARLQMQQRLGGGSADGFLKTLGGVSSVFGSVPGASLQAMAWKDNRLDLRVRAGSGDVLAELANAAVQAGIAFEVTSTVPREGGVEGAVSVSAPGARP